MNKTVLKDRKEGKDLHWHGQRANGAQGRRANAKGQEQPGKTGQAPDRSTADAERGAKGRGPNNQSTRVDHKAERGTGTRPEPRENIKNNLEPKQERGRYQGSGKRARAQQPKARAHSDSVYLRPGIRSQARLPPAREAGRPNSGVSIKT